MAKAQKVTRVQQNPESVDPVISDLTIEKPKKEEARKLWEKRMWAGVIPTWRCLACGQDLNSIDDAALHIAGHFKQSDQAKALDQIMNQLRSEQNG